MDFELTHTPSLLYSPTRAGPLDILLFFVFPSFLVSGFFAFIVFLSVFLGFFSFYFLFSFKNTE
jgi:hypothetical protein